ncbi:MAG: hypothetical protein LBK44_04255 [Spirochaetales bacterium]|nr:hypothetical protein [Spirochaetales bacterium]
MRSFFAACLLFCGFFFLAAEETDYYRVLKDIREENAVLAFVQAEIEKAGERTSIRDFSDFAEGHSFSRVVRTSLSGGSPQTLVVAAPAVCGGGGFSAALALDLWRESRKAPAPLNLVFLFLGGDGAGGFPGGGEGNFPGGNYGGNHLGSRLFLDSFFSEYPVSVLYLNFAELPARILCETGTRGVVAPSWMLENAGASLEDSGLPFLSEGSKNRIYRLGLAESLSAAGEYLSAGCPALGLSGEGRADGGDYADWEGAFQVFFRSYVTRCADGSAGEWDQHYLFLYSGSAGRIIGEPVLVFALVCVLGISMLYAVFAYARLKRYAEIFLWNIWNLPLILFVSALFFIAGTALVHFTAALRNTGDLWSHHPFIFFILKASCAVFLILLSLYHLRRLPLLKNGSFYSASAIFCFLVNVFLSSALDITFIPFLLWSYTATVLFSIFRRPLVKIILFFIALLPFCITVIDTFFLAEKDFAGFVINSPFTGNLLLSSVFLPFILMLIRIDLLLWPPGEAGSGRALKALCVVTGGVSVAAFVFALAFNPWKESPQPLFLEEYVETSQSLHELRLSSPSPLGSFDLSFGGENFPIDTGERVLALPLGVSGDQVSGNPLSGNPLPHRIRGEEFLGRKTYTILFSPPLKPRKITVHLSCETPLLVYNCNFPYSPDITGHAAEVFIGENPPLPLNLILTFPVHQEVSIRLSSWSPLLSAEGETGGKSFALESYSKLVDSFIIETDE